MARTRKKSKAAGAGRAGAAASPRHTFFHRAFYFLLVCLFVVLLMAAGLLLISRTPGFASGVADRIQKVSGLPVFFGAMRLTPGMTLIAEELRLQTDPHAPYAVCELLRVERPWQGNLGGAVYVRASYVRIEADGQDWRPRVLAPVAEAMLRWNGTRSGPPPDWQGPPLTLLSKQMDMKLRDAPVLSFKDVALMIIPLQHGDLKVVYWKFSAHLAGQPFERSGLAHEGVFHELLPRPKL